MNIEIVGKEKFAQMGADIISDAIDVHRPSVICFPAGDTPLGIYKELADRHTQGVLDTTNLVAITLDEYIDPPSGRSCYDSLTLNLYDKLRLTSEQRVTFNNSLEPEDAAHEYDVTIRNLGGLRLSVLGIGLNGHVGFNEPGVDRNAPTHVEWLSEMTVSRAIANGHLPPPKRGITVGVSTLLKSREILLIAKGKHKADVIRNLVHGEVSSSLPVSYFHNHSNCRLLIDEDAASNL